MITFYSFCWSVIISSICIIISILFRRNSRFLLNFNLPTLLFLFLLCMIRMLIPFEFPHFQKIIDSHTYSFIMKPYAILSAHYSYVLSAFIIIWIIGIFYFFYRFCKRIYLSNLYLHNLKKQTSDIAMMILAQIDAHHKLSAFYSESIEVPMVCGLFHSTIYLPTYNYTEKQLYHILLHEYTHYKNRDLWIKCIIQIFCIIFWWNPIVYLLCKNLDDVLELKCDATLAQDFKDEEKISYLETLLYTLRTVQNKQTLYTQKNFLTSAFIKPASENFTKQRFQYLLNGPKKHSHFLNYIGIVLISIFFFSSYYFLLQPSYEAPREELWGPKTTNVIDASNSYLVPKDAHTYFLYYNGNIIDEISAEEVNASFNYYLPIKNQEEK